MYRINLYGVEAKGMIKFNSFEVWANNRVEARNKVINELAKIFSKRTVENEISIDILEA